MEKQSIFGGTQLDQLTLQPYLATVKVDFQAFVNFEQAMHGAAGSLCAPQDGFDTADQLARTKGLGDVIICTKLKPAHAVILLALCSEHDNRYIADLADCLQHFKTIQVGHHYIKQDEIGGDIANFLNGLLAVKC